MAPATTMVDESAPLLRELRDAADKGFTGALDATAGDRQVSIYLEDGEVRAIQSAQFEFPMAQLAENLMGEPVPEGAHPLQHLSTSGALGEPHIALERIDGLISDWSYGLLASALTWTGAKTSRRKKAEATGTRMYPKDCRLVIQDVTARVDELVTSWDVISAELARRDMDPRPASHAAPILVATVPGDPDLDGTRSVDEVAYWTGTTRGTILSRIAAAIISGTPGVDFHPAHPESDLPTYPTPESMEDPSNEWARPPATLAAARAPEPTPEPEPAPVAQPVDEFASLLESSVFDVADEPAVAAEPEPVAQPFEPEPEPVTQPFEPEPEPLPVEPYLVAQPVAPPFEPGDGGSILREWVDQAEPGVEHEVREAVLAETTKAASNLAAQKVEALDEAVLTYEQANADLAQAQGRVESANADLAQAQAMAAEAEHVVACVREQGQAALDGLTLAQRAEAEAAAQAALAEAQVAEARAALERAEASRRDASGHIEKVRAGVASAQAEVERTVGVPLRAAEAELEKVRVEIVEPTQAQLESLLAGVEAVRASLGGAEESVQAVGAQAEKSINVLALLEAPRPHASEQLFDRLRQLHERVSAVRGVPAHGAGTHRVEAPQPIDATQVIGVAAAEQPATPFDSHATEEPAAVAFPAAAVPFAVAPEGREEEPAEDEVALPVPAPGMQSFDEIVAPTGAPVPWNGAPAAPWKPVMAQG